MHRTTRTTVLLLFAAWTVDYVDRQVINLALPSIGTTFGLSHGERGLLVSAFFLAYAAMQIPGGLHGSRRVRRRVEVGRRTHPWAPASRGPGGFRPQPTGRHPPPPCRADSPGDRVGGRRARFQVRPAR
ncbi:hypothetical protein ACFV3R_29915 [Streptomyces sp. NPDC059740]|uniref:hypothetical protein n=1 Tax=Streptomyces sp. NPDC059740 TaxID=3346926 RepID=UPI00364FAAD2